MTDHVSDLCTCGHHVKDHVQVLVQSTTEPRSCSKRKCGCYRFQPESDYVICSCPVVGSTGQPTGAIDVSCKVHGSVSSFEGHAQFCGLRGGYPCSCHVRTSPSFEDCPRCHGRTTDGANGRQCPRCGWCQRAVPPPVAVSELDDHALLNAYRDTDAQMVTRMQELASERDALRARVAELEADTHVSGRSWPEIVSEMQSKLDTEKAASQELRARVAELRDKLHRAMEIGFKHKDELDRMRPVVEAVRAASRDRYPLPQSIKDAYRATLKEPTDA